jgi:hypothetical protein
MRHHQRGSGERINEHSGSVFSMIEAFFRRTLRHAAQ